MNQTLPMLTEDEVRLAIPANDEAGFGSLATERGHLPLKALEVHTRIDGLLAETEVRQYFVNTLDTPLEATYIFPLPDRAAVTRFRMEVAGRVIDGVLKERGQARREYDQAIQEGRRAAITEEERSGVFTMRVGNLLPGEEAAVRLTLVGPLPYSNGEVTYRFPLVVAPRYIPGKPLSGPSVGDGVAPDTDAVPDASRVTPPVLLPGYPNPVSLSLCVDVAPAELSPSDFRASLHTIVEQSNGSSRHIRLNPGERLDRDFILRFRVGDHVVRTSLCLQPDAANAEEGTFVLTLVPPVGQTISQRSRDVIFVLDRSGSMEGWKMVSARRALARMVDTLIDQDRFNILAFDDRIETPPEFGSESLVPGTNRHRFQAIEFLAKINSRGGTEMAQPLDRALKELATPSRERDAILVLVTDGQIGNEDQILRELGKRLKHIRIFTLGIDRAVNAAFLQRLAALGGGACELVESEDRLDEVMDQVHRRIGTAVLTKLRLEPAGLGFDPGSVVPSRKPDLFAGSPLFLMGRYHGAARGGIALHGADGTGQSWDETVLAQVSENSAIAKGWARAQVRELEDLYTLGHHELEKRIVDTSLKFGVLCRFTAFVAVDKSDVVNQSGQLHKISQPVEAPSGWDMLARHVMRASVKGPPMAAANPETFELSYSMPAPTLGAAGLSEATDDSADWARAKGVDSILQELMDEAMPINSEVGIRRGLLGGVPGFLRRLAGGSRDRSPHGPAQAPDLSSYRQRARELHDELVRQNSADLPRRLQVLAEVAKNLTSLVADLELVIGHKAEVLPLAELVAEIRKLPALPLPSQLQQVWLMAAQVLESFAGPVGRPRESFWK
jgi:Ca-activated chloride channel family protein